MIRHGALRIGRALEIAEAIASALAHAHKQGIVHRDIKPENVFLDKAGTVKVGDFGIAKLSKDLHGAYTLTAHGSAMGTPTYMPPEQRASAHEVDGRADIYSLGVVLYEMLTGRLPPAPVRDEAVVLEPVDPRVDEILRHAVARDRDERYALAADLERALTGARLGA